jgi:hypothetical protein
MERDRVRICSVTHSKYPGGITGDDRERWNGLRHDCAGTNDRVVANLSKDCSVRANPRAMSYAKRLLLWVPLTLDRHIESVEEMMSTSGQQNSARSNKDAIPDIGIVEVTVGADPDIITYRRPRILEYDAKMQHGVLTNVRQDLCIDSSS